MSSPLPPSESSPVRALRNRIVTVKFTKAEKAALEKYAFDLDVPVSQIMRKALGKAHPHIFNGRGK